MPTQRFRWEVVFSIQARSSYGAINPSVALSFPVNGSNGAIKVKVFVGASRVVVDGAESTVYGDRLLPCSVRWYTTPLVELSGVTVVIPVGEEQETKLPYWKHVTCAKAVPDHNKQSAQSSCRIFTPWLR